MRKNIRKRGADISQALLYAAFALITVLGGFALYETIQTNMRYRATVEGIVQTASEGRLMYNRGMRGNDLSAYVLETVNEADFAEGAIPIAYSGNASLMFGVGFFYSGLSPRKEERLCRRLLNAGSQVPNASGYINKTVDGGAFGERHYITGRCSGNAKILTIYFYK